MHEHGPDELQGPVRGTSTWWRGLAAPPDNLDEGSPNSDQPKKKRDTRPIRIELVERVRKEIAAGTYDTEEKWEAALDCLLERLE